MISRTRRLVSPLLLLLLLLLGFFVLLRFPLALPGNGQAMQAGSHDSPGSIIVSRKQLLPQPPTLVLIQSLLCRFPWVSLLRLPGRFPAPPCFHLVPKVLSHFLRFYSDTSPSLPPSGQWFPRGKWGDPGGWKPHPFQSVSTQPPICHLWNCRATPPSNHQSPLPTQSQSCIVGHQQQLKEHHILQSRWKDNKANLLTF